MIRWVCNSSYFFMYYLIYWAYSEELQLNYIGSKVAKDMEAFRRYRTSSSNLSFKRTVTYKRIIEFCSSKEHMVEREVEWQLYFNVAKDPMFANKVIYSKGFIQLDPESVSGENNPFYGRQHTEESRKRISEAGYKRFSTPEARAKHGECQRGITKHSEESKKKIGDFFRGRKRPQHEKDKISMAQRDHTPYLWLLKAKGSNEILEEKVATLQEMKRELGLSQGNLSMIKNGKRKQTRGWHCTCLI